MYHFIVDITLLLFQVTLECTGEAPENVTVTMQCNETGLLLFTIDPVEFRCLVESAMPVNITRLVPNMPLNEQCNISIVFSNGVGSSEPFILTFGKYMYSV